MDRITHLLAAIACLLVGSSASAQGSRIPPPPSQFVTDNANFLSASTRSTLESSLENYERRTGHQLLVWIGRTTGGTPIEDWAAEAFRAWRIGRKGIDDGVAIFVIADDRQIRIEVGYGLEGVVPDAKASQIIRDVIVPRIRAGDRDGAITAAVDGLVGLIGGDSGAPGTARYQQRAPQERANPLQIALCTLIALAVLIFLATHPTVALFLFSTMLSGRGRGFGGGGFGGGGGGGGGGFSGGGGSSGGGGASGSW